MTSQRWKKRLAVALSLQNSHVMGLIVIQILYLFRYKNVFSVVPLLWLLLHRSPGTSRKEVPSGVHNPEVFLLN